MKEIINIITAYISLWNWFLLAIIFLGFSVVFAVLDEFIYFLAFIFVFTFCAAMSGKRKREFNTLLEDLKIEEDNDE